MIAPKVRFRSREIRIISANGWIDMNKVSQPGVYATLPERNRNPHEKAARGGFVHSLNIVIYPMALYHAILQVYSFLIQLLQNY